MFQTGDLLWIPQGSVILSHNPNAPLSFQKVEEPRIGLYISQSDHDRDFSIVMLEGRQWAIKNKHIMHYRRKHASKVN